MLENKTEEQAKEEILAMVADRHIKRATESLMQAVYLIIKK